MVFVMLAILLAVIFFGSDSSAASERYDAQRQVRASGRHEGADISGLERISGERLFATKSGFRSGKSLV